MPVELHQTTVSARPGPQNVNLMIFHGTYHLPGMIAGAMYDRAQYFLYRNPSDPVRAERLCRQTIELEPSAYFAAIDLGNFALGRKDIAGATTWYRNALDHAPPQFQGAIQEQLAKLAGTEGLSIPPLHGPDQE